MHIVFLNPGSQLGGAERSLLDVLASLRAAKPSWELTLISGEPGPLIDSARNLGARTHVLEMPARLSALGDAGVGGPAGRQVSRLGLYFRMLRAAGGVLQYGRALAALLQQIAPTLLHTNGFKMHLLGAWVRPPGVPLVWHVHDYVETRPVMSRLLRWHRSRVSAIVANSHSVAEGIRALLGERIPVQTVWNAIDLRSFSPFGPQLDLDATCGLPQPAMPVVRVGLVGTLARWKGHELFLRALSMLPKEFPLRAYIIGDALYRTSGSQWSVPELQTLADQLGLRGRVGFTGFVSDPAQAMRNLDVVVHASTEREPFGLVIAEAMACGRAVIVSRKGGPEEFTQDQVNALAHNGTSAAQLAALLTTLTEDRGMRERLGTAAREFAELQFDRTRLAQTLIPIYEGVCMTTAETAYATTAA